MSYMVTTSEHINNVSNVSNVNNITDTYTDNDNYYLIEPFRHALHPLVEHGWKFAKSESNIITMYKLFHELEEITIEYSNNHYHFTLPINNSIYSYYRKIRSFCDALNYLELYVDTLC